MEQIALRLVKITVFIVFWIASSRIIMGILKEKKPGLKIYEPEVLFPSVLGSALATKLFMMALTAVIHIRE